MDLSFIYELKTASKELKMNLKKALATVYNICTPKANDDLNEFYRNFDESTCIRNLQGVAELCSGTDMSTISPITNSSSGAWIPITPGRSLTEII